MTIAIRVPLPLASGPGVCSKGSESPTPRVPSRDDVPNSDFADRPSDWPKPGPIDLNEHDLPHGSSTTEWWYLNTHLTTVNGRNLSLFAAFFRIVSARNPDGTNDYAHSLTWAISDADTKEYFPHCLVDAKSPEIGLDKLKRGHGSKDERLNRAMEESLKKGTVPRPDRIFSAPVIVARDRLALDFGGNTFVKLPDGTYALELNSADGCAARLTLELLKPPVRHGDDGVVRGVHGEDMFYYFVPRCAVRGSVTLGGVALEVATAQGWYDHEFGCPPPQQGEATPRVATHDQGVVAWNWASAQLDDGSDLSVYDLVREDTGLSAGRWAILIDPHGARTAYPDFTVEPLQTSRWQSLRTFESYATALTVEIPGAGLSLKVTAAFEDQEFVTVISKPAFWEGRCVVEGTRHGVPIRGLGYVERSGFAEAGSLDEFFRRVGEAVRASVRRVYPLELDAGHAQLLIATPERQGALDGVDLPQLARALLGPVRAITDRGGKAWRSYAALACCDVVLGDSRKFSEWLAMPELMHVGSLIVDDVQDQSSVRRGGPAAHLLFGEAVALNAGTAAYFLGERLLRRSLVSDDKKLSLYDLYFEALRAGHAGQAIDLDGLHGFVDEVLTTGDSRALEARVLAIHRLKTATPAASMARMGALAGGGSTEQIEAVGRYFEAVGLAFQMIDDVLNLRGFAGNLKTRGEDIAQGKVTLPIARALGRLPAEERRALWAIISKKPQEPDVIERCIDAIERVGGIESCATDAREMVEQAWTRLEPVVEESLAKVMLRAFGWYVLERHY